LDDVSRGVGDDDTKGIRRVGHRIRTNNADFHLRNAEAPTTRTETVQEALQRLLNLLGLQFEDGTEVDEHMVEIRVARADDLERIEDVVDNTIRL